MVLFLDKNKNVCGFINEKYKYIFYLGIDENELETIDFETDLKPDELINKKYENGKLVDRTDEQTDYIKEKEKEKEKEKIKNTLTEMVLKVLPKGETLTTENVPSLIEIINPATTEESGTQANPIVIVDNDIVHIGYLYTYGKYYKWNDVLYHCERRGESEGGTIKLFYTPDQLIGHYFVRV